MPVVNPNATNALAATSTPEAVIGFVPLSQPQILAQSAIPLIRVSSGTLSAAGALSGIVALGQTYPNCWLSLPAAATDPSDPAGVYFAKMSSTTAGTVFRNRLVSGAPFIPTAAALISCTNASSYTATVTLDTVVTIPIPANSMGPNGAIEVYTLAENDLAAGTKNGATNFGGGLSVATFSQTTTNIATPSFRIFFNKGVTNSQVAMSGTGLAAAAGAAAVGTLDTTTTINLTLQLQAANAGTNTCQYTAFSVIIRPQ
jgi:hypothetical protein